MATVAMACMNGIFSTIICPCAVAKPDWKVRTACAMTVDKKYMLQPIARGTGNGCHSIGQ